MSDKMCDLRHAELEKLCDEKHNNLWHVIADIKKTQVAIFVGVGLQLFIMVYDVFLNKHIPQVQGSAQAAEQKKGVAHDEPGLDY